MSEELAEKELLNLCATVSWTGTVTSVTKEVESIRTDRICTQGGRFISQKTFSKGDQALISLQPLFKGKAIPLKAVIKVTHIHILHGNLGYGIGFSFVKAPSTLEALIKKLTS